MRADAALYQDKFLVLDEVSLQRRVIRGKYRCLRNCYFATLALADLNTIRLLRVRDREILRFSVLDENSFSPEKKPNYLLASALVAGGECKNSNLVDPASSHTLVSKIKPCMSKYKGYIQ